MNDAHDEHVYELTNLNLFIFEGNSVALPFGHSGMTIHGMMPNEVLARSYYTVELLMTREDVQKWAKYASRQRWGTKRG